MKLDDVYVVYEHDGKIYNSYSQAFYRAKHSIVKKVNYVFVPTWKVCKNTSELYRTASEYFNLYNCDYIDVLSKQLVTQNTLF